jgi:predicted DCC family thiol-disulfide oxidoreductase YuxK
VERATVFYDAGCGFCRWSARRLQAWDRAGRLRFASLSSEEADERLAELSVTERSASWHLVDERGRLTSAGAAVPPLLERLPFGKPLAAVAARFPRATDRAYRFVSEHRDLFGRVLPEGACVVLPDRNAQDASSSAASSRS